MLFDSHAHYNDKRFDFDRNELLSEMKANNVGYIMNACSSIDEIPLILELAERFDFVYASVGVHPHEAEGMSAKDIELLREYAKNEKVRAIGEIGLDYFYDNSPRELQKKWFAEQVELAKELSLPVIIHDRDAHEDTLKILSDHKVDRVGGVFHCYSGSAEMAKSVLAMNMYIAFGGAITFKNAHKPCEVARYVPLERILIETDCPYLTPEPHRGERNSSLYLHYVAEKIAELKEISVDEVISAACANAKKIFKIS